jgi:hypothetical protein
MSDTRVSNMSEMWLLPLRNELFSWGDRCKLVANAVEEKYTGQYEDIGDHESQQRLWCMQKHMIWLDKIVLPM